jgi:hypothetical protein
MSPQFLTLVVISVAWLTIGRAVLVFAQKLPPTCPRCWKRLERRYLGEQICAGCE